MEEEMEETREWLEEEIKRMMERATEAELDLVWRFLKGLVA